MKESSTQSYVQALKEERLEPQQAQISGENAIPKHSKQGIDILE